MALIVPDEKRLFWTTLYIQASAASGVGGHLPNTELTSCCAACPRSQPLVWVLFSLTSLLKVSLGYLMLCLVRGKHLGLLQSCRCIAQVSDSASLGHLLSDGVHDVHDQRHRLLQEQQRHDCTGNWPFGLQRLTHCPRPTQRQGPRSAPGCQDSRRSMSAAACSDDTMQVPACHPTLVSHSGFACPTSLVTHKHACTVRAMLPR